jgi:hypothetical protein
VVVNRGITASSIASTRWNLGGDPSLEATNPKGDPWSSRKRKVFVINNLAPRYVEKGPHQGKKGSNVADPYFVNLKSAGLLSFCNCN